MAVHTLKIATNQRVHLLGINNIPGTRSTPIGKGNFEYGFSYKFHNGVDLNLWTNPLLNRRVAGFTILQTELSHFQSWDEFICFMHSIIPDFDLKKALVKRIDLYIDIPTPLIFFKRCLHVWRKRKTEFISSDSDSYIIGKSPIRISIYEKHKRLRIPDIRTRVEVQYSKQKCPIKCLAEAEKLLDFDPFKNFLFYEYLEMPDGAMDEGIRSLIHRDGLQIAVQKSIGLGRLRRFVQKGYFRELGEPDLSLIYRQNLKTFLKVDV